MPALPAVPGVLRVALQGQMGDANVANILHFKYTGAQGTAADLNALASQIVGAWASHILPDLSDQYGVNNTKIEDLTSDVAPVGEDTSLHLGGSGSAFLSATSSVVISHHISRRYRGGHPRTYLAGILQADLLNPQTLNDGNVATFDADWANFIAEVVGLANATFTPLSFVNVSYRHAKALRDVPVVDPISSSACQQRICSQRRRAGVLLAE